MANEAFDFAALLPLRAQVAEMPPLTPFTARDGATLSCRHYPCRSSIHAILVHGSSGHSAHVHAFARYLSSHGVASVSAPDLRGHGPAPQRRGDIDYIGQLEDDLADLIAHLRSGPGTAARMVVGGFSSGGGMALRLAGSRHGSLVDGVLLLAPYLGHGAPMLRQAGSGGRWAHARIGRIVGLSVLNGFGITSLNGTEVLRFSLPGQYRSGHDTVSYSFRLMKGMHPGNYRDSLRNTKAPLLILVGAGDEAMHADRFSAGILPYKPDARIHVVRASHLGLMVHEPAMAEAARWIETSVR